MCKTALAGDQFVFIVHHLSDLFTVVGASYSDGQLLEMPVFGTHL